MSHASIPAEVRAARGLPDDLVRISGAPARWLAGWRVWVRVGWAVWLRARVQRWRGWAPGGFGEPPARGTARAALLLVCGHRVTHLALPIRSCCRFANAVGIEDVEDLLADLDQAFQAAQAAASSGSGAAAATGAAA